MKKDTMNIKELIAELSKFPNNLLVETEGCDCIGNVVAVKLSGTKAVLLKRDN